MVVMKMNKRIIFELDISRWPLKSRECFYDKKFTVAKKVSMKQLEKMGLTDKIKEKSYCHSWGDAWSVGINVRDAKPREKVTNKFMEYEWMIKNILNHNSPYNRSI